MRRRPVGAGALAAAVLLAGAASAADYLGSYTYRPEGSPRGGLSALWLDPDGAAFVALSDRGAWLRGTLSRDAAGAVDGVTRSGAGPLLRSNGGPLEEGETDAEGIAWANGAFYVSYEGLHRVVRHGRIEDAPDLLPQPRDFAGLQENSGLEALAADGDGALYAIPERSGRLDRPFPVYRMKDGAWDVPFTIPRRGRYLVAGADVGPDGRLYVLERDFALLGFRSRVRSFDLGGGDERVELETGLGTHDNLEGIAVWRDGAGRLRATMVSDDNLQATLQRTEFVDYVLTRP